MYLGLWDKDRVYYTGQIVYLAGYTYWKAKQDICEGGLLVVPDSVSDPESEWYDENYAIDETENTTCRNTNSIPVESYSDPVVFNINNYGDRHLSRIRVLMNVGGNIISTATMKVEIYYDDSWHEISDEEFGRSSSVYNIIEAPSLELCSAFRLSFYNPGPLVASPDQVRITDVKYDYSYPPESCPDLWDRIDGINGTGWERYSKYAVGVVFKHEGNVFECISEVDPYSEDTATGNVIESSHAYNYLPAYAFDDSIATRWSSGEEDPGVNGVSYIGWDYGSGETRTITSITLTQGDITYDKEYVTSVKLQKSDNGSDWEDVQTFDDLVKGENFLCLSAHFTCRAFRFLANSHTTGDDVNDGVREWDVREIDFTVLGDTTKPLFDQEHWRRVNNINQAYNF